MDIHDRLAALEAQHRELTTHLDALRAEVSQAEAPRSRRDMFKTFGVAAAGAVGGALAFGARPAAAADNAAVLQGSANDVANTFATRTALTYTGTAADTNGFTVSSDTATSGAPGSFYPAALAGWAISATGPSTGVYGYGGRAGGYGVAAVGRPSDGFNGTGRGTGLFARGGVANMELANEGAAPASRADAHKRGEILADANGDLWYCSVAGTPGTWQLLAGPGRPVAAAAASSLVLLPAPFRITDTRTATGPAATGAGPVATGVERVVDLSTGWQGSTSGTALPSGATGAVMTFTIVDTVGAGFLAVIPDGVTYGGTSSTNWSATGQILATTVLSTVTAGKIKVRAGGAGSANYVIDLVGYIE